MCCSVWSLSLLLVGRTINLWSGIYFHFLWQQTWKNKSAVNKNKSKCRSQVMVWQSPDHILLVYCCSFNNSPVFYLKRLRYISSWHLLTNCVTRDSNVNLIGKTLGVAVFSSLSNFLATYFCRLPLIRKYHVTSFQGRVACRFPP